MTRPQIVFFVAFGLAGVTLQGALGGWRSAALLAVCYPACLALGWTLGKGVS